MAAIYIALVIALLCQAVIGALALLSVLRKRALVPHILMLGSMGAFVIANVLTLIGGGAAIAAAVFALLAWPALMVALVLLNMAFLKAQLGQVAQSAPAKEEKTE